MIVKIRKFNSLLGRLHKAAKKYEAAAGGIVTIIGGVVLVLTALLPEETEAESAPSPE